ncbi:MAG: exo-alpha-sialidase [Acidobacteriota bacterium]
MRSRSLALCFALASLLVAQPVFEYLVAPARPGNQRNSEADVLRLKDGRLLLAWTCFSTDQPTDWAPARIAAMISTDEGRSWGAEFTLQENIGQMNVMEPDLLRLKSGKVLFLFCRKNSPADCLPMARISTDDARTFSPPVPLPIEPRPSYTGFNHDRAIQLRSGRILMPVFFTTDYRVEPRIRSRVYYSDDEGRTWKASRTIIDVAASKVGAQEPGAVELKDGRVLLWLRASGGRMYQAFSRDRGETWSAPEPSSVVAPVSPQSIKRIPSTGHLLLVWNNSPSVRFPLTTAISRDEGRSWEHLRNLDEDAAHTYAYTGIEFTGPRVLFTYYAGPPPGTRGGTFWSLKLKSVPVEWLYGRGDQPTPPATRAEWEARRRETQAGMEQVMGPLPRGAKSGLDVTVLEEVREAAFTRKKLTFAAEAGDRVPAYLFLPHGRKGRAPALLCLHQTTRIGKAEPAGLGGNADLHYARELAERGYVTLAPDYPGYGDYKIDPYALGYASASMKGIRNHIRAVDLLASLPEVDPRRIGAIGHSLGGHNSLFVAAFEPRIRAVVTSCGFNSFAKYYGGNLTGWSHKGYMPRIADQYGKSPGRMPFDFPALLASLAPRPVFINAPLGDKNFEVSGVRDCLDFAAPVYTNVFRAGDRLVAEHPDCGHAFPPEIRRQAYAFLDRWLGPQADRTELIEVRKIWDQAPHNAFTDLIRYRRRWYCAFREAAAHVSPDGALRILTSGDGRRWASSALVSVPGRDLRDPKLAVTPDGRLMLTTYSVLRGSAEVPAESLVWFSPDGGRWDGPARIGDPNFWLWRVTWHKGVAYSIGYGEKITRLYSSRDGVKFDTLVPKLFDAGYPNETAIRFLDDGTALCLLRRDGKDVNSALLGTARPPYRDWSWKDLGVRAGGPNMIRLKDGRIVAAVRLYDGKVRTALCWLSPAAGKLQEFLTLPSGGDTSYAGLVWHDGLLWVSYYSSHEGKTRVYLARVRPR